MSDESRQPDLSAGSDDLGDVLRECMEVTGRLQRTHEALQGEVVRLRRELASKDRELELRRRLAALGELAAGVAHEVRNPLGAIRLYSGLLRDQCHSHHLDPALRLIEKIEAGIQAIDTVVEDALALAPRDRRLGTCDLCEILRRAVDATREKLEARQVQLTVEGETSALHVRADEAGLQRVLVNLIANAADASEPGQRVWVRIAAAGDEACALHVIDEGTGIADDVRDRIFDPFFTTKAHGTGLGLTIAHRLIQSYGGQLTVADGRTGGAEFQISLPRADALDADNGPDSDARQFSAA